MMALIFIVLLIAVISAWVGRRNPAIYFFMFSLLLSVIWFLHHVTSHLELQL